MTDILAKSWDVLTEAERMDIIRSTLEARTSPCGFGL